LSNFSEILVIESDISELKKAESFLYNIFKKRGIKERHFKKVFLCVSEAIMNSIYHGNDSQRNKKISVKIEYKNDDIILEISDEGEGFDYKGIEDPTIIKNLRKESGRGLYIIKSLCNQLEFKNNGSCIRIKIGLK